MSSIVKLLKEVKQKCTVQDRLFCSGFARIYAKNDNVPVDIVYFLILFYRIFEEWDVGYKGSDIIIRKSDKLNVNDICECRINEYSSAFGINKVNKGYHHWTLKLLKFVATTAGSAAWWRVTVGILDSNRTDRADVYFSYGEYEYVWNCDKKYNGTEITSGLGEQIKNNYTKYKQYGAVGNTGDIIDIYLDFDNKTLSYGINGIDYGVASKNINEGTYRLAVSLTGIGTSMQIISYKQTK